MYDFFRFFDGGNFVFFSIRGKKSVDFLARSKKMRYNVDRFRRSDLKKYLKYPLKI